MSKKRKNHEDDAWVMDLSDLDEVHREPTAQDIEDVNRLMADYRQWEARRRLALGVVFGCLVIVTAVIVTAVLIGLN